MSTFSTIKVLTFTTLYPNSIQQNHGIFVENRLRHLVAGGRVKAKVVAPVPWFPTRAQAFGRYGDLASVPSHETRKGIEIFHPRYPTIPKFGMTLAPFLLYHAAKAPLRRVIAQGFDFDLIDAHYFYPDGVAAALLGRYLKKPVVITARGTDINLISRYTFPRGMIRWAANNAAGVITVCNALKSDIVNLGVRTERIRVLRNGVDLLCFRPLDRDQVRKPLRLKAPTLLSVGSLVPSKGHDTVITALPALSGITLLIAGDGPYKASLERLAKKLRVTERVRFLGPVPHERLLEIYNAADLVVLASEREGWPNVLLEAMACGTPAIASRVGGIPEAIQSPAAGVLLNDRTPQAVAYAVKALLRNPPTQAETRAYAERFDWSSTTQGQLDLFCEILGREPAA